MISPASCQYAQVVLDYLSGTLDDPASAEFEAHVNDCPECLTLLGRHRSETEPESEAWPKLLQQGLLFDAPGGNAPLFGKKQNSAELPPITPEAAGRIKVWTSVREPGSSASGFRYAGIRHLGSGGCGDVWEAWDELLGRRVALKFLKNSNGPLDATHRFIQEANALARLSHPHIVSIHELQNDSDSPVLVMELVEGPTLADYLQGRPCPAKAAAALVEQLCQGIQHAHSLGVIHRDLKPSNILLRPAPGAVPSADNVRPELIHWVPKIADFGLAQLTDQPTLTLPGQPLGTPCYMAPEQVSARGEKCGIAADIYGLGAILYEILTGRPPFVSSDPALTMAMILREDPVSPRALVHDIPLDLETVCLKCLRKAPRSRYKDAAALRDDCLAFLQNRPVSARPVSRPRKVLAWGRRHPAEATAFVAAVSLLIAVSASSLRTAQLSDKLLAESTEKVRLLEHAQSLRQQHQESVRAKFDQLLRAHHHFLLFLENRGREQPVDAERMRSEILRSAAEIAGPYIEVLDQKTAAGERISHAELRLAVDYLDLAFNAGASLDFSTRLPTLQKLIANLPRDATVDREFIETRIRVESIHARFASRSKEHVKAGQFHQNMADLIDQQLLTYKQDDPQRIERLYMKAAMLLNSSFEYTLDNRRDLGLVAVSRAEEAVLRLIKTDPENQDWLIMLLEVRLRKSHFLPPEQAAKVAVDTASEFHSIHWTASPNAEKARHILGLLQAGTQVAVP